MLLPSPIAPGTALLQYVETTNDTASGAAQNRREWCVRMMARWRRWLYVFGGGRGAVARRRSAPLGSLGCGAPHSLAPAGLPT